MIIPQIFFSKDSSKVFLNSVKLTGFRFLFKGSGLPFGLLKEIGSSFTAFSKEINGADSFWLPPSLTFFKQALQ